MIQAEAAQRLSVPKGTIANWVAAAKHGRGPVNGAKSTQDPENDIVDLTRLCRDQHRRSRSVARLRRELAEVKQEKEILKKAAAYLAKESQ